MKALHTLIDLNTTRLTRHHNIAMKSIKSKYSFHDLLNITFIVVFKLSVFYLYIINNNIHSYNQLILWISVDKVCQIVRPLSCFCPHAHS